ncbi:MAG: nucleotide exchange factor GrpE [bacterium]|nr:nucleotide exchange factor GrpE [bacterium]
MEEQDPARAGGDADVKATDAANPLEALQKERDEYLNGWKRAKADLINYKKEEERRLTEVVSFSNLNLVRELISGMDSFDLALNAIQDEGMKKNVAMIKNQFSEILKRQRVVRIPVTIGSPPDPKLHEAISESNLAPEQKELDGKILEELVAGYLMGDRVIRAAKVKIGKM